MREKNDLSKILEGRCRGVGAEYTGFKRANESHSIGTACEISDPIAGRTVDVLSMNEMYFYWITRFDPNVAEIREQFLLVPQLVTKIAMKHEWRVPQKILTTDFVVLYNDGTLKAYSIKSSRKEFANPEKKRTQSLIRRQTIEKEYWNSLGVGFEIIFGEDLNRIKALNIRSCFKCYDNRVTTPEQMYRHMIAHHIIETDLESGYVPFAKIAKDNEDEIRKLYKERCYL